MLKQKAAELNSPAARVPAPVTPRIIPRSEHSISRSAISPNALRVLYRLRDGGFQAFLVGGCVRDLLLGIDPKDFDVATDALPEQVRKLFRNCRLVGRRFRLAHVFFGRETIEVATFRAATAPSQGEEPIPDADPEEGEAPELDEPLELEIAAADEAAREVDETGRILRDNVYGSIDADVWRRDFTANALYYNIADFSLWDYMGGAEDIAARTLRLIGDPETRYREDPVRMLRGARFEAKLGFRLDPGTAAPIGELRHLLAGVPSARLFDETLKLFLSGHGARSLEVLRQRGLLAALLPSVEAYLGSHPGSLVEKLLVAGLVNTDARALAGKPVTPTFLFALLLYGPIAQVIEATPPERWHELSTILDACDRAVREAQAHVAIPRRFALGVREMFSMQPRLEHPRGRRALKLLEHPRFRAAFDLLVLRAEHGLAPLAMAEWWARIQSVPPVEQAVLADSLAASSERREGARRGPRRRRRRSRPASSA
ncbi:MAG TPA: polynucleotide adenylyltransferase PcnB [Steroidobacteraceae bacterium]|nr:polynucleotide adenylyltransferase PcnB [Steroidobacteraceae bacterium]